MTQEQYRRANGAAFWVIAIILGYLSLSMVGFFMEKTSVITWKSWLQIVVYIVALIVAIIGPVTQRGTKRGAMLV